MQRASNAYMDRVGNLSGALAYQNYADERSRQQQAASMAPDLAATDYYDIAQLGQVGAAREAMEREKLAEDVARESPLTAWPNTWGSLAVGMAGRLNPLRFNPGEIGSIPF